MRARLLLVVVMLAALCAGSVHGQKHRRRHRRIRTTTTEAPAQARGDAAPEASPEAAAEPAPSAEPAAELDSPEITDEEHIQHGIREGFDEQRFQAAERARVAAQEAHAQESENEVNMDDPCLKVHCSAGRTCDIDEHGDAVCNCIKQCPYETDSRRKVCTNHNETWESDCEVYRQRCLCLDGASCRAPQYHHVQIEYYGVCRLMPECTESDMSDFPRRMRDWLFNIMRDLAERRELSPHYASMEREAEADLTRRWTNAAIWKWCDLDAHDNDRFVSRHELFPIRAPLMSLEHCIAPFLDRCDEDDDHRITLHEWGKCLQLDEYELEDRCDEITDGDA